MVWRCLSSVYDHEILETKSQPVQITWWLSLTWTSGKEITDRHRHRHRHKRHDIDIELEIERENRRVENVWLPSKGRSGCSTPGFFCCISYPLSKVWCWLIFPLWFQSRLHRSHVNKEACIAPRSFLFRSVRPSIPMRFSNTAHSLWTMLRWRHAHPAVPGSLAVQRFYLSVNQCKNRLPFMVCRSEIPVRIWWTIACVSVVCQWLKSGIQQRRVPWWRWYRIQYINCIRWTTTTILLFAGPLYSINMCMLQLCQNMFTTVPGKVHRSSFRATGTPPGSNALFTTWLCQPSRIKSESRIMNHDHHESWSMSHESLNYRIIPYHTVTITYLKSLSHRIII